MSFMSPEPKSSKRQQAQGAATTEARVKRETARDNVPNSEITDGYFSRKMSVNYSI